VLSADQAICEMLERHTPVLTVPQIARSWFSCTHEPLKVAGRFVRRLAKHGVVQIASEMLHPELDVSEPLLSWEPTMDESPDLGRVAWRAKARFSEAPTRTVVARLAGKEPRRTTALIHDVMLAGVFLDYLRQDASVAERWRSERDFSPSELPRFGNRLPDAVLREENHEVLIDCIGSYDKRRLTQTFEAWKNFYFRFY